MIWRDLQQSETDCLRDESGLRGRAEKICFPTGIQELQEAVTLAAEAGAKLTIQGARTGLMGGSVPMGGWVLNTGKLNKLGPVEKLPDGSGRIRFEAGVTLEEVRKAAAAADLMFPSGPTETTASMGGIFAANAAGPDGFFYGKPAKYILSLTWVTPEGQLWEIPRGRYRAQEGELQLPDGRLLSAGEGTDLIDLLAGTEGYLGAAASMEGKLLPRPAEQWGILFFFDRESQAADFGRGLQIWRNGNPGSPVHLTAAEYFNGEALNLLRANRQCPGLKVLPALPASAGAAVYGELAGDREDSEALMELLDLFESLGGREEDSWAENGAAGVQKLRNLRHTLVTLLNEQPDIRREDGSRLEGSFRGPEQAFPQALKRYAQALAESGIRGVVYGHLLENCLNLALLPEKSRLPAGEALLQALAAETAGAGGNPAGEYGVGKVRKALVEGTKSASQLEGFREYRALLDPGYRMNP